MSKLNSIRNPTITTPAPAQFSESASRRLQTTQSSEPKSSLRRQL